MEEKCSGLNGCSVNICIVCVIIITYCRRLVMYVLCTNYVKPAHQKFKGHKQTDKFVSSPVDVCISLYMPAHYTAARCNLLSAYLTDALHYDYDLSTSHISVCQY